VLFFFFSQVMCDGGEILLVIRAVCAVQVPEGSFFVMADTAAVQIPDRFRFPQGKGTHTGLCIVRTNWLGLSEFLLLLLFS
jgi:hypothetical protein